MSNAQAISFTEYVYYAGTQSQLEVKVHTSLPPLVGGRLRGHLGVYVGRVEWSHSVRPPVPRLSVRLAWWGQTGQAAVFRYVYTCAVAVGMAVHVLCSLCVGTFSLSTH